MRKLPPSVGCLLFLAQASCGHAPDRHITAASTQRLGQAFEIEVVARQATDCRVRSRLPEPYAYGAWIDVRNSAVNAARRAASVCCADPQVAHISDWMAGFAAWEISFKCDAPH